MFYVLYDRINTSVVDKYRLKSEGLLEKEPGKPVSDNSPFVYIAAGCS